MYRAALAMWLIVERHGPCGCATLVFVLKAGTQKRLPC
jgi:hypothetical protein